MCFLNQAADVVTDNFAQNFIRHRHVAFAANMIAKEGSAMGIPL
jgi:hypothetical protein